MHTQGGITYLMMGYVSADGTIPAWKIKEHQLADRFYDQAQHDKRKSQKRRGRT